MHLNNTEATKPLAQFTVACKKLEILKKESGVLLKDTPVTTGANSHKSSDHSYPKKVKLDSNSAFAWSLLFVSEEENITSSTSMLFAMWLFLYSPRILISYFILF